MYVPVCVYTMYVGIYLCICTSTVVREHTHYKLHVTNQWINTATPSNSVINCTGTNCNLHFMTSFVYSVEWLNGNK